MNNANLLRLITETVRGTFQYNELKRLQTINQVRTYAINSLAPYTIGSGSSRTVFRFSSGKVLKVALHDGGIIQNKEEYNLSQDKTAATYVAKIFDHDPQFKWLVSEIAKPISEDLFKQKTGFDLSFFEWYDYQPNRKYVLNLDIPGMDENDGMQYFTNPTEEGVYNALSDSWVQGIFRLINDKDMIPNDMAKPSSWGQTVDGRIVLVDYGFVEGSRLETISAIRQYSLSHKTAPKSMVAEAYVKPFNYNEFIKLPTPEAILRYAEDRLPQFSMGTGGSRRAYRISNKKILKIAMHKGGIAQNRAEINVGYEGKYHNVIADVYEYDPRGYWIISEPVQSFRSDEEMEEAVGFPPAFIEAYVHAKVEEKLDEEGAYELMGNQGYWKGVEDSNDYFMDMITDPWIKELTKLAIEVGLVSADFIPSHFGKTLNGRVVLLDYGYTTETKPIVRKAMGFNDQNDDETATNPF